MSTGTAHAPPALLTLEEWAALDEEIDGELVDGVLVEEEMAEPIHEIVVGWLAQVLRNWGRPRDAIVLSSGVKFGVSRSRGRIPDLSVFLPGGARLTRPALVRVPPTIAVEVVSPTPRDARRDRVEKLAEYAAFGIRWYWLVDPALRTFEILELGADGRYAHAVGVVDGRIEDVPGCGGLVLDVGGLWGELDAIPEGDDDDGEPSPPQ